MIRILDHAPDPIRIALICMNLFPEGCLGPRINPINSGCDPDYDPYPGSLVLQSMSDTACVVFYKIKALLHMRVTSGSGIKGGIKSVHVYRERGIRLIQCYMFTLRDVMQIACMQTPALVHNVYQCWCLHRFK